MKSDTYDISVTKLYNQISFIPTYRTEINYILIYSIILFLVGFFYNKMHYRLFHFQFLFKVS